MGLGAAHDERPAPSPASPDAYFSDLWRGAGSIMSSWDAPNPNQMEYLRQGETRPSRAREHKSLCEFAEFAKATGLKLHRHLRRTPTPAAHRT